MKKTIWRRKNKSYDFIRIKYSDWSRLRDRDSSHV